MKAEVIARLNELAHQEKVLGAINEFNDLVADFHRIQDEEERQWEIKKLERIEAGEKPKAIDRPIFELLEDFRKLTTLFKDKKKIEVNAQRDIERENLNKKRVLVAALADLIQNEESIGRAIARFKDIQESWKKVGSVPRDKRQSLQTKFSNLVENFRYNINIYKDIKDHDLNRNLKLKKELIENLKGLLGLERIKEIEEKLHAYQDEWNNIGGTHQSEWEKIKNEYWDTINTIYEKVHKFYKGRREERSENIDKKKVVIEKAKEINTKEIDTHKGWKRQTDVIIALQEEWKQIGLGPKEEDNAIWNEFRAICNAFFRKKKIFYKERNSQFDGVKERKEVLIMEVAAVKDSTNWKETSKKIVDIQKRWKEVGSAGPKYESKLWTTFREHIDDFFNAKDEHFKRGEESGKENLKAKEDLIRAMEKYKPVKVAKKAMEKLKEFSSQFAAIGTVPFKEKDRIHKAYKIALEAKYDEIDMDQSEKEKIIFEAKLDGIGTANNYEYLLNKERQFIKKKISKLNDEINKFETNMSFFANADENNPLFKSVVASLAKTKESGEELEGQLKMIRILENRLSKEKEEMEEATESVETEEERDSETNE